MGLRRRWADLVARVHKARHETGEARQRLERTRAEVADPSRRALERNEFAALIRDSLRRDDRGGK